MAQASSDSSIQSWDQYLSRLQFSPFCICTWWKPTAKHNKRTAENWWPTMFATLVVWILSQCPGRFTGSGLHLKEQPLVQRRTSYQFLRSATFPDTFACRNHDYTWKGTEFTSNSMVKQLPMYLDRSDYGEAQDACAISRRECWDLRLRRIYLCKKMWHFSWLSTPRIYSMNM